MYTTTSWNSFEASSLRSVLIFEIPGPRGGVYEDDSLQDGAISQKALTFTFNIILPSLHKTYICKRGVK
jgi:hypothetical protein